MKVLITGTAGFIGMHLAIRLSNLGHDVFGMDNINSYYDTNLKYERLRLQGIKREDIYYNKLISGNTNIRFIELDLQDAGNLHALFSKQNFDIVINLAAQAGVRYSIANPKDYIDSNITGFFNLLEVCRNFPVKHLIYASSSSVYGNSTKTPFEETDQTDDPISFYAATKKSNEIMAHTYCHLYGIKTTGLRFFTVYGPYGRPDMAMFLFTRAIVDNKTIQVFNNGNLFRDFTFIDDIISGIELVFMDPGKVAVNKVYNIGNGNPVKLMDFIKEIELKLKIKAQMEFLPIQEGDVLTTFASTARLKADFGYESTTTIKEGVSKFIDWYVQYYNISIINK